MNKEGILALIFIIFLSAGVYSANLPVIYTDNWHDFYGYAKGARIGDNITVKDSNGIIDGSYVIDKAGEYGFMHVYGDELTTRADEGAKKGERVTFYYNNLKLAETAIWKGNREKTFLNFTLKDSDRDGVLDVHDSCPRTGKVAVDKNGCSASQFCSLIKISSKTGYTRCELADWKNNEAGKKPGDCLTKKILFLTYCTNTKNAN